MNQLFREMKENKNIDFIEESDSEEDFETKNTNYIVNNELIIECIYSEKFKAWIPNNKTEKVVTDTKKMIRKTELS